MSAEHSPLPFDLVEGNEHHGPYIVNAYGADVCDFYAMSNPSALSVRNGGDSRPIWHVDAAENAAFLHRAGNAHDALAACRDILGELIDALPAKIGGAEEGPLLVRARAALTAAKG